MNLFDEFKNICRQYYYEETINLEEDFNLTKDKIRRYFEIASKENLSYDFEGLEELREQHSMSLVYLGILFNDKLNINIKIENNDIHYPFNYVWNILCFYHDLGYIFENDKSYIYKVRKRNQDNQIKGYNYKWNIINSKICFDCGFNFSYNRRFTNSCNQVFMNYSRKLNNTIVNEEEFNIIKNMKDITVYYYDTQIVVKKSQFYKSTAEKYYKYRIEEMGKYDHGILGGYMLFNNLVHNYIIKMQEEENKAYFIKNSKIFRIDQLTLFSYISDCIVNHNIFFPTDNNIHVYEEYGLNELILFNKPFKLRDNPLLFLLYLVDSLDPIKYFNKETSLNSEQILKSINISFIDKGFELNKGVNSSIDDSLFKNYIEKISTLASWLDVQINMNTENTKIKIEIVD